MLDAETLDAILSSDWDGFRTRTDADAVQMRTSPYDTDVSTKGYGESSLIAVARCFPSLALHPAGHGQAGRVCHQNATEDAE
jgi:hypothetical protein